MTQKSENTSIVRIESNYSNDLMSFENALLAFLNDQGLPTSNMLVPVEQRVTVFKNLDAVITMLNSEKRQQSIYISKFVKAVPVGLFDAALNYLWNETINELRLRVAQYDLSYFYDTTVKNPEKRKKLKTEADLVEIDDSELVRGAKEIGLISEIGFRHLDNIRYMRNWASAAHPNQNEITGLDLITWLEKCIKEVISLPLSNIEVDIRELLTNVKTNALSDVDAKKIAKFFLELSPVKTNSLAKGFFGIYVHTDTTSQTRQNIHKLLPYLWQRVDDDTRKQFGIMNNRYTVVGEQESAKLSRQFLELVSGLSYLTVDALTSEIEDAIDNLLTAHRGFNNFYNEPIFANELLRLVGEVGKIPSQVNKSFVLGVVEVFLTNGNGVARSAEPIYIDIINKFNSDQALLAVLSFTDSNIVSRLQFSLCQAKFRALIELMREKVSSPVVKELIQQISEYGGPLDKMKDVSHFKLRLSSIQKILENA